MGQIAPSGQIRLREIAVSPLDVHLAQFGHDGQDRVDAFGCGVVRVDQQGDVLEVFVSHRRPMGRTPYERKSVGGAKLAAITIE